MMVDHFYLEGLMEQDGQLDPVDPAKIQVESKNGKVVLRGGVMTEFEKARAEHILTAVPGVKEVANNIVVFSSTDPDDKLAKRVRTELLEAPNLKVLALSVEVQNAVAKIYGIARDPSQRKLVGRMVRKSSSFNDPHRLDLSTIWLDRRHMDRCFPQGGSLKAISDGRAF